MNKDTNQQAKIIGATFIVFEGDIVRDENGHITNKVREVMTHSVPESELQSAGIDTSQVKIIPHQDIVNRVVNGE
jgi:hypothetical protein